MTLDDRWRALIASGKARWCPGMLSDHGRVVAGFLVTQDEDEAGPWVDCTDTADDWPDAVPDWTDPATIGCLLGLVREVWGDPAIHCAPALYREGPCEGAIAHWHCYAARAYRVTDAKPCATTGGTEAEALIAALEAAPEVTR